MEENNEKRVKLITSNLFLIRKEKRQINDYMN